MGSPVLARLALPMATGNEEDSGSGVNVLRFSEIVDCDAIINGGFLVWCFRFILKLTAASYTIYLERRRFLSAFQSRCYQQMLQKIPLSHSPGASTEFPGSVNKEIRSSETVSKRSKLPHKLIHKNDSSKFCPNRWVVDSSVKFDVFRVAESVRFSGSGGLISIYSLQPGGNGIR